MQQITNKLHVGNVEDALQTSCNGDFDVIVYLGQEAPQKLFFNCTPLCVHIPLNDGQNGLFKIRKAIFTIYILSLDCKKILISCRAGISRSVSIATAIYALTRKAYFEESYNLIREKVPQAQPKLNLLKEVKQVTEELKCCL